MHSHGKSAAKGVRGGIVVALAAGIIAFVESLTGQQIPEEYRVEALGVVTAGLVYVVDWGKSLLMRREA